MFTKSRNSIKNAIKGYRKSIAGIKAHQRTEVIWPPVPVPHFMSDELFTETIGQAARNVHKRLCQVEYRTQAPTPDFMGGK